MKILDILVCLIFVAIIGMCCAEDYTTNMNAGGEFPVPPLDLEIVNVTLSPDSLMEDKIANIIIFIANSGRFKSEFPEVDIYIDDKKLVWEVCTNNREEIIAPYEGERICSFMPGYGNHTIKVVVDPKNNIRETNETNNIFIKKVFVKKFERNIGAGIIPRTELLTEDTGIKNLTASFIKKSGKVKIVGNATIFYNLTILNKSFYFITHDLFSEGKKERIYEKIFSNISGIISIDGEQKIYFNRSLFTMADIDKILSQILNVENCTKDVASFGMPVYCEDLNNISLENTFTEQFSFDLAEGQHNLTIIVDPQNLINESNKYNNEIVEKIFIVDEKVYEKVESCEQKSDLWLYASVICIICVILFYVGISHLKIKKD